MLRTPRQPRGSGPRCGVTLEAELAPVSSHLQRQEDGAAHHFASEHSQHPASSRVQVQLSERKPGPFLPLIALHCCSRSLHSPYIHLSLNYKLGN